MGELRKLNSHEIDDGYAILLEAYERLKARGSHQWLQAFPYAKYRLWHDKGLNYGFFSNDALTTVLSLVEETDDRWHDFMPNACVMWIRAVAGSNQHRGSGFGKLAIQAAVHQIVIEQRKPLYLHCYKGKGFLPAYYSSLNFKVLSETELDNGPWVLMKHAVPEG